LQTVLPCIDVGTLLLLFLLVQCMANGQRRLYLVVVGLFLECISQFTLLLFNQQSYFKSEIYNQLVRNLIMLFVRSFALFTLISVCLYIGKRYTGYQRQPVYTMFLVFFFCGSSMAACLPLLVSIVDLFSKLFFCLIIFDIFFVSIN